MKNHPVLNLLVFTAFLVVGFTISTRFYQDSGFNADTSKKVSVEISNTIASLDNGQRSFLLIYTSSLTGASPRLVSVWLATNLPPSTTIQLLAIYPSGKSELSNFEKQLDQSFSLNNQDNLLAPAEAFFEVLKANNYWWSGYVVYDGEALAKAADLLGGITKNSEVVFDSSASVASPEGLADPLAVYSAQLAILQSLCDKLPGAKGQADFTQLSTLVPDHLLTNLDGSRLQDAWDALYTDKQQPTCRFPTLEISGVVP